MAVVARKSKTFRNEKRCFLCGEPIIGTYVHWQGGNGKAIGLHRNCAEYLAINLLSDCLALPLPVKLMRVVSNDNRN